MTDKVLAHIRAAIKEAEESKKRLAELDAQAARISPARRESEHANEPDS